MLPMLCMTLFEINEYYHRVLQYNYLDDVNIGTKGLDVIDVHTQLITVHYCVRCDNSCFEIMTTRLSSTQSVRNCFIGASCLK